MLRVNGTNAAVQMSPQTLVRPMWARSKPPMMYEDTGDCGGSWVVLVCVREARELATQISLHKCDRELIPCERVSVRTSATAVGLCCVGVYVKRVSWRCGRLCTNATESFFLTSA